MRILYLILTKPKQKPWGETSIIINMIGTKILEERKSKYNGALRVVNTWGMGTYIQSDGLTQSGGIVEGIWRQTLKQIVNSKLLINNCLILGLGGGTVAKLIRKNWPGANITGVDIDSVIVDLGKKYLGLGDQNVEIIIDDAMKFVSDYTLYAKRFDLVVVDLYNGDQFPKKFESENYIHLIRTILTSNGVAVFNRLYYKEKKKEARRFGEKLRRIFSKVEEYRPISNVMFICRN